MMRGALMMLFVMMCISFYPRRKEGANPRLPVLVACDHVDHAVSEFWVYDCSKNYDRYLKNNFSDINNKTVRWVRMVTYAFAVWYLFWNFVVRYDNRWLDSSYYLFLIVTWVYIYNYAMKHVTAVQTGELLTSSEQENDLPLQPEEVINDFNADLESYMNREKTLAKPLPHVARHGSCPEYEPYLPVPASI